MEERIDVHDVKLACDVVSAKLVNVETEVKEIEDGLELLMHSVDSNALKDFLNCLKWKCLNICDVTLSEAFSNLVDLEAGIDMLSEQTIQLGVLPGLKMQTLEDSEGNIVEIDEKTVQKRTRRKKNSVNVDEVQEENAKTLDELFNNDNFMKVKND